MTNLHKLQERIDTITALLQQVEALQPRTAGKLMGNQTTSAYNAEEVTNIQYQITQWGLDTYNIAAQTVGHADPNLQYFYKRETQDKQLAQTTYTNLWELTHPDIETTTKTMVDQGNYTQALEQAIKTLNGTIAREKKQHHPDSVLALLQTTNTATLTQEQTMRLLLIASEVMYRIENE